MKSPGVSIWENSFNDNYVAPNELSNTFFIKGIIHITHKEDFEVLQEEFFYSGLESNGCFLSQSDIDVYLDYHLREMEWEDFEPMLGRCYSVMWVFKLNYTESHTPNGSEYDSEIDTKMLYFDLIDKKHTKWLLEV